MNPRLEEQVRIISTRDEVFTTTQTIQSFKFTPFILFSLVPEYTETDISKIVAIRGGADYLHWIAKLIKEASPMLSVVVAMKQVKETNAFVPSSPGPTIKVRYVSKPIDRTKPNNPSSRPRPRWKDPNDPNEYCPTRPSQESKVQTEYFKNGITITDSDIRRIKTPQDQIFSTAKGSKIHKIRMQKINAYYRRKEVAARIAKPDEVFQKVYRDRDTTVFVTHAPNGKVKASLVDTEKGRLLIDTELNDNEYASVKDDKLIRFDLTDLRRDVQTGVINEKSLKEYDSMQRAIEQNLVPPGFKRPENPMSQADYLSPYETTAYEIKQITQNKFQTYYDSADNVSGNIKKQYGTTIETNEKYIIDLSEMANDVRVQNDVYECINQELINHGLKPENLIYLFE